MSIFNTIAFTKLNGIIAHDVADKDVGSDMIVMTFARGLKNLGYLLSEDAYKELCNLGDEKASRCLDILQIKAYVGAHVNMKAFYPNFPAQVMEASEVTL